MNRFQPKDARVWIDVHVAELIDFEVFTTLAMTRRLRNVPGKYKFNKRFLKAIPLTTQEQYAGTNEHKITNISVFNEPNCNLSGLSINLDNQSKKTSLSGHFGCRFTRLIRALNLLYNIYVDSLVMHWRLYQHSLSLRLKKKILAHNSRSIGRFIIFGFFKCWWYSLLFYVWIFKWASLVANSFAFKRSISVSF